MHACVFKLKMLVTESSGSYKLFVPHPEAYYIHKPVYLNRIILCMHVTISESY